MAKNKKLHSFAFASALGKGTPTKTVTREDGMTVTLYAFPLLPASPFRTMDSRSNIEFSYVAQQLIDDYNEQGRRHPLDIEHNTERGGDTRARGWSVEMSTSEHEPDVGFEPGVLYCWYELTPLGLQEHADQLYGYTSAVANGFWLDEHHVHFDRIKSNARTNNPAAKVPFSLTAVSEADAPADPAYTPQNVSSGDNPVMLKALLEALGLTNETDEATALSAIGTLKEQASQAPLAARIDASDISESFTGAFVAATRVDAVQTELTNARTEVQSLTAQLDTANKSLEQFRALEKEQTAVAAVDAAVVAGRIKPAQREMSLSWARNDLDGFQAFAAKQDVQVPTTPSEQTPAPAQEQLSAAEREYVTRVLGATEADYIRGKSA